MGRTEKLPSLNVVTDKKPPTAAGPYLALATICERVLQDADGVLSLIRVIDRVTVAALTAGDEEPPESMPPSFLTFSLVVALRSGKARGEYEVEVRGVAPNRKTTSMLQTTVVLEGEETGANVVVNANIRVAQEGLYWFDVYCGGKRMTRIPLRVIYNPGGVESTD